MSDEDEEVTPVSRGWRRRDIMIKGAVAGGVLWAAPVVESFTSKAYASAGSPGAFACSYATIIFTVNGVQSSVKLNDPSPGCNLNNTDGMYGGTNLGSTCGGVQYAVDSNNVLTAGGNEIPDAPSGSCSLFTLSNSGCTVTAASSVTINFVLVHDGSYGKLPGGTGTLNNGTTLCAPGNTFTISGTCGCP